jgi:hypothetical protein
LAVERQKTQLGDMERQEAELLAQRDTVLSELNMMRGGAARNRWVERGANRARC